MNDTDRYIEYINRRIEEISKNNNLKNRDYKIIDDIQLEVENIENDIGDLYNKYLRELNELVGLKEVKEEVKKLINYLIFINKMQNKINIDKINLNMIFRGNPGTGKTTVARIIAKILCDLGFLKSTNVLETTPRDFVAGYVGQTAIKAKKTIESAKGGVVFIDEAYTFSQSADENGHTFVYEAITEIIKEMENFDTVFIFSGYDKPMENFIELNPGIKSRIGYDINFSNYSKEELFTMLDNKVNKSGMVLSNGARKKILEKIEENMRLKNFGNGRMIDNLFNQILREHASNNIYEIDEKKLLLISEDDIKDIKVKTEGGMCFG